MEKIKENNYNLKQYYEQIVQKPLEIFEQLTRWSDEDREEFKMLLEELKKPFDKNSESTKAKGDRLEDLVAFIIRKTYFFSVYRNIPTGTNEIDEVIVMSDKGLQTLHSFNISREIIGIKEDIFLGECKNYENSLNVTYVGKFYSVMIASDVSTGIIFTKEGLTGNSTEYHDAYGLTKVLRIIEKYKNNKDFYIIDFKMEDYEKIANGVSFFDLIKAKKMELQIASSYEQFLKDNIHSHEKEIIEAIREIKTQKN